MKAFILTLSVLLPSLFIFAQKDVSGSKDHPVVSRFNGAWIRFYDYNKFDQYKLRVSAIKKGSESLAKYQVLEGALT